MFRGLATRQEALLRGAHPRLPPERWPDRGALGRTGRPRDDAADRRDRLIISASEPVSAIPVQHPTAAETRADQSRSPSVLDQERSWRPRALGIGPFRSRRLKRRSARKTASAPARGARVISEKRRATWSCRCPSRYRSRLRFRSRCHGRFRCPASRPRRSAWKPTDPVRLGRLLLLRLLLVLLRRGTGLTCSVVPLSAVGVSFFLDSPLPLLLFSCVPADVSSVADSAVLLGLLGLVAVVVRGSQDLWASPERVAVCQVGRNSRGTDRDRMRVVRVARRDVTERHLGRAVPVAGTLALSRTARLERRCGRSPRENPCNAGDRYELEPEP